MFLMCDLEISKEAFVLFKEWYMKNHPDFKGIIRRAVDSLYIAEIIDTKQNLKRFRFMRG